MKIQLSLALCAVFACGASFAANNQAQLVKELESISAHIGAHTDEHAVTESLYHQIRSRVVITNKHLKTAEINKRVRSYISKKYTPIFLMNYSLLFGKMKKTHEHFSNCDKLQPFEFAKDIKTAICTIHHRGSIHVRYLINDHNKGWEKTSEFEFKPTHNSLKLVAIKLYLKKDQKFHVDGI